MKGGVEKLLQHGAKADQPIPELGVTPLYVAAGRGWSFPIMQRLLARGADPSVGDFTPFYRAIMDGKKEAVRLLTSYYPLLVNQKSAKIITLTIQG